MPQHATPRHALAEMIGRPQWVAHRAKRPIDSATGRNASPTDPGTWGTYAKAVAMVHAGRADGIGFVLTADDPFFCIDLDHCRDADTGEIEPWAWEIVGQMDTYCEVSPSGAGLHIWGAGRIPAGGNRRGNIELYDCKRFVTVTERPIPGYNIVRPCQDQLAALHAATFPATPHAAPTTAPVLTLDDRDIVDRLHREKGGQGIAGPLLAGDHSGHSSPSEARFALASKVCFYTDDPEQIARIVRSSGLFRETNDDAERDRKAACDAQRAADAYAGPRYDPAFRSRGPHLITPRSAGANIMEDDPALESMSPDELRAIIREQTAIIDAERAARIAAEERADSLAIERSGLLHILRNGDLGAERLTGFAVALDLHARLANGEQPTEHGIKAPAVRYAEMTGQSEGTVARHLRALNDRGLITKRVVRETTEREIEAETVDHSSGEIRTERETVRGLRDANYIDVPEGKIVSIIDRLCTYQRPDDAATHGGTRTPRPACERHPDAGTVTVRDEHIECAHCRAILETREPTRTYHPAETDDDTGDQGSGSKMTPETTVLDTPLSGSKLIPELCPELAPPPAPSATGCIMLPEPETASLLGWEDERAQIYGALYRGDTAS